MVRFTDVEHLEAYLAQLYPGGVRGRVDPRYRGRDQDQSIGRGPVPVRYGSCSSSAKRSPIRTASAKPSSRYPYYDDVSAVVWAVIEAHKQLRAMRDGDG